MLDIETVEDPAAAAALMDPLRARILSELTEPRSAAALAKRLADVNGLMPELDRVRWMSAVSLGRLKAREQLAILRQFYDSQSEVGLACRWAIREITGETLPGPKTKTKSIVGWFLEPLNSSRKSVPPKK